MYRKLRPARTGYAGIMMLVACLATASAEETFPSLSPQENPTGMQQESRGVLRARAQATLSSDLAARIVEMPFREGQAFSKGDLLVRFDCAIYQAQLAAATAATQAAEAELDQNRLLAQMKSVGQHKVDLAAAHLAKARAEKQVYQIQVNRCRVSAPFSGRVVTRHVQQHESVPQGAPLLEIVDNRQLEIHLLIPSRWSGRLQPGQTFMFTPDETGKPLEARVSRLGARIDEGSQTLGLIAEIVTPDSHLLAGMSGTARFPEQP